ncbi:lipase family protein [Antrihabitans cavernicola]|uniref:Lipase n=1 Tax=Antrihabitans cavernicola TaxID=2495913 RepID=A0A5A7SCL1_9NOCA|nr:lipase family protein [Spelaeibacter cavernicola]KAA0022477.1 hypothetical protein FOY51_12260 [Spelaeibacter cavernicola]
MRRSWIPIAACVIAVTAASPQASAEPSTAIGSPLTVETASPLDPTLAQELSRASNFTYQSTFGNETPTVVSGALYEPKGAPPAGGWPLIAYAHGTSGISEECAPTHSPDLFQNVPIVKALVEHGWAVAATDYQGLGTPGQHRYLDSRTEARSVLDAARAARRMNPTLSDRVMLYGVSQGAQATQAAAEVAGNYAPELKIQGNAMDSPALNLVPFVAAIDSKSLTATQYAVLPLVLVGVAASDPTFRPSDVLHGLSQHDIDVLVSCTGIDNAEKFTIAVGMNPSNAYFATMESRLEMAKFLAVNAFPQRPPRVPTFVARGTDDTLILPSWTDPSVTAMRVLGGNVQEVLRPGVMVVQEMFLRRWIGSSDTSGEGMRASSRRIE